jgi:hypothetical protein
VGKFLREAIPKARVDNGKNQGVAGETADDSENHGVRVRRPDLDLASRRPFAAVVLEAPFRRPA